MKQVVSFSGGKDSTAMLLAMLERGERIDAVVFFDFGMEFPELYAHIQKVRDYVEPRVGQWVTLSEDWEYWFSEVERDNPPLSGGNTGYSWPTMRIRWCTAIKRSRVIRWRKENGFAKATTCIGIALDEPDRLKKKHLELQRYPLAEYGMTESDCLKYCLERGYDFGGLYDHFKRLGCYCCPLKSIQELRNIFLYHKREWRKLLELEEIDPFLNCFRGHKTVYDLHKRFSREVKQLKLPCIL